MYIRNKQYDDFKEYINNYMKYKINLIINDDLDKIYNLLIIYFCLTNSIINFNLINSDQIFIIN